VKYFPLVGREIRSAQSGVIAIDRAHHPARIGDAEIALGFDRQHLAIGIDDLRAPRRRKNGWVAEPG